MGEAGSVEILLVEDDPQDLELTLHALGKANLAIRIEVARDGVEALGFIFCTGAHTERRIEDVPKLILLDLHLPKIDGLDVLHRIKGVALTRTIPVVVLTSSREQTDVVRSNNLGIDSYIVKPVTCERFVAVVQELGIHGLLLNEGTRVLQ